MSGPRHPFDGGRRETMTIRTKWGVLCAVVVAGCAAEMAPAEEGADLEEPGSAESALCKNALTRAQEKTTLKLIDDICGDTWCEGDNNFAFVSLTCRAPTGKPPKDGSCTLALDIIPRVDEPPRYRRSCTTRGFSGYASLVTASSSGYQQLAPAFYDALSECINQLESELPR
jgi:hypothetical protein